LSKSDRALAEQMGTRRNYVAEHRLVAARTLGRALRPDEVIHHLNGVRDDNRPENLLVTTSSHHNHDALAELYAEIARLRSLLMVHGISF